MDVRARLEGVVPQLQSLLRTQAALVAPSGLFRSIGPCCIATSPPRKKKSDDEPSAAVRGASRSENAQEPTVAGQADVCACATSRRTMW
jgi:hypothetical protein